MKTHFSEKELSYDGTQLKSLYAYMNFKILGDSIVSWCGACDIPFEHMVDGEDVIAGSEIRGARMLHFIIEKFNIDLFAAVSLQRLMASQAIDLIRELSPVKNISQNLRREGDDIYFENQKLSISIASRSNTSAMVHFAMNIVNEGTPVSTLCLGELKLDPVLFSKKLMEKVASESISIAEATQKVRGLN